MALPKLKYFIQCDEVRNEGGKFSAIGIFDAIYSLLFPATHKHFGLLLGFMGAVGEYGVELQVLSPDGQCIARTTGNLRLVDEKQTVNVAFGFDNFPLPSEGEYRLSLFVDGDFFAEHVFRVEAPAQKEDRTPEEIQLLLSNPEIIKVANAEVTCDKCQIVYRFQHHLDPAAPVEAGFLKLPPGEFFACGSCGKHIQIGQVRKNLQHIVGISRKWFGQNAIPGQEKSPDPNSRNTQ